MTTPTCVACGEVMDVSKTGMSRTHERSTFEVTKFTCSDCETSGFRAWESFESSRYKSSSEAFQWGALADDDLYPEPPWLAPDQYAVVMVFEDGDVEEFKRFDSKTDAEKSAARMSESTQSAPVSMRVEPV